MARQNIEIGVSPNDGTGETLRDAMLKVNENFIELFGDGSESNNVGFAQNTIRATDINGNLALETSGSGVVQIVQAMDVNTGGETLNSRFLDADGASILTIDTLNGRVGIRNDSPTASLTVTGNVAISGNTTVSSSLTLGTTGSDRLNLNSRIYSSALPGVQETFDVGSPSFRWNNSYIKTGFFTEATVTDFTATNINVLTGLTGKVTGQLNTTVPVKILNGAFYANLFATTLTEDRNHNLPDRSGTVAVFTAVPPTNVGVAGNRAGDVAINASYLYYCTGTYDGSTVIWKRAAFSTW